MRSVAAFSFVAILLVGIIVTAACGGDDDDTQTPTTAGVSATATTPAVAGSTGMSEPSTPAPAGDATEPAETSTVMSTGDDEAVIGEMVDTIVTVIVERDRDRLRDFTGAGLRQRLQDQDLDRLMECVPDGATIEPVSRTVTVADDTATAVVTLEVTDADGTVSTVERTWLFERDDDGTWKLAEIPDCPFES